MDLLFNENLQPVFDGTKDYKTIDGRSEFEQWIELNAIDRLYSITSRYKNEDVPLKIELEISRIADKSDLINTVKNIDVQKIEAGYEITAQFAEAEDFELLLNTL